MVKRIDLSGRVAIVTGAGNGLGREHALLLARRGAKVVVNDLGGRRDGSGGSLSAAQAVVAEIEAQGGVAMANGANVCQFGEIEELVKDVNAAWGRIDILVNNAGILRDRTFAKADLGDFSAVLDVHLKGAVNCTKAVWEIMRQQEYGRVVFTTSSSGLYGNFGQSAYGTAKMALVGLMNTLHIEGEKHNIRVNCLAPSAATRMTEDVLDETTLAALVPAAISPGMLMLVGDEAPSRLILCAGAGSFEAARITLTRGLYVGEDETAAERLLENLSLVMDAASEFVPQHGWEQSKHEIANRTRFLQDREHSANSMPSK